MKFAPMKIAIFSLTRDRIFYTKHCFSLLLARSAVPYDHYVIDNGSEDGTADWLKENASMFSGIRFNPVNTGNNVGNNQALEMIRKSGTQYDLIIRMDNDCEVVTNNILVHVSDLYRSMGQFSGRWAFSPRVTGIVHQPQRLWNINIGGYVIGATTVVGGLFRIFPADALLQYHWPEERVSKVFGEECVCSWFRSQGGFVGYIEDVVVNHFETTIRQVDRYPEYHERKLREHDEFAKGIES